MARLKMRGDKRFVLTKESLIVPQDSAYASQAKEANGGGIHGVRELSLREAPWAARR
jgi:hypothetical protein